MSGCVELQQGLVAPVGGCGVEAFPHAAIAATAAAGGGLGRWCAQAQAVGLGARLRSLVLVASRYVVGYKRIYPRLVVWKEIDDPLARLAAHRRNLEVIMIANPANIAAVFFRTSSASSY